MDRDEYEAGYRQGMRDLDRDSDNAFRRGWDLGFAAGKAAERERLAGWLRSGPPQIWANVGEASQIAGVIEWLAGDTTEPPDMPTRPALPWERDVAHPDQ